MDTLELVVGALGGGLLVFLASRLFAREPAPAPAPPKVEVPPPKVEVPPPKVEVPPPKVEVPPPLPAEPPVRVVALLCPQCGGALDVTKLRCSYCQVPVSIEGRRPPRSAKTPARRADRPPPFQPPADATVRTDAFGRFDMAVLRQPIHASPRETMRWVPIDAARAALFLVRVVEPGSRSSDREPLEDPELLAKLARAAEESLRARRDPGLAAKATLRALVDSGQPGALECFIAVFDAEKSQVLAYNAGCSGALVHASIEERRTIDAVPDRHGVLEKLLLAGEPDAFANGPTLALAAGDALVVGSAGLAGDGRGWGGARCVHEALRAAWPGGAPVVLARSILDAFWTQRENASRNDEPPCGDIFLVAVTVKSNKELRGDATVVLEPRTFETERFRIALAPSPGAYVAWKPLRPGRRATVLVWAEGLPEAARDRLLAGVLEVLDGETGDNDNPRAAGRRGLAEVPAAGVRLLVLWLGDEHGKAAFFQRGWRTALDLLPRGERGGSGQQFDEGGEHWPKPGGRLLFPGALPVRERCQHLDAFAGLWPGGKASALYATCLHHEDDADAAAFLASAARAARTDAPEASLDGLAVLERKPET